MARRDRDDRELMPIIAELLRSIDDADGLPRSMARLARSVTPAARSYVTEFHSRRLPRNIHIEPTPKSLPPLDDAWDETWKRILVLNPFYAASRAGRTGCLHLREVMPEGFEETEYFRQYYVADGFIDELIHLTPMPDGSGGTIVTGLVRGSGESLFNPAEIALQRQLSPVLESCALRLAKLLPEGGESPVLADHVENALGQFGVAQLTEREHQVIELVLRGHNTESIAHRLEIARDTVKLHRRHAYAKLRVSSQGELFFKFLESLPA